jgi:WD40 repeat protein
MRLLLPALLLGWVSFEVVQAGEVEWRRGGLILIPKVMRFSDDGERLITAGDHGIKQWDTGSGAFLGTWSDPAFGRYSTWVSALSSDGRSLLWGGRNLPGLNRTHLEDGTLKRQYPLYLTNASVMAWSLQGQWVAVVDLSGTFVLRDLETGLALPVPEESIVATGEQRPVLLRSVGVGDLLVSFADSVERWEVGPARVRWRISRSLLAMDGTGTRGLAISGDVTPSPVEVIWMEDGTVRASWPEPLEGVRSAAFSPDGDTVALGRLGVVEIRETSTGAPVDKVQDPDGNAIFALAWHPAGHQIALVTLQGPHLWTLGTDAPPRRLADIPNALVSIAASPDGTRLAAVERYRNLLLLDAVTGREKYVRTEIRSPLEVAWPGTGLLAVGYERDVVWCDHQTFMPRRTNSFINANSLQGLAAARSVARVLRADSGANFTLMDSSAGRVLFSWRVDGPGPFRPLALSPEGARAAARLGDGSVRVWATDELNPVEVGRWEDAAAVALEFDPDGEVICGVSQRSAAGLPARVWRWIPGSPPVTVDLDAAVVEPLRAAFSADCRLVLIQDGTAGIAVCDTETGHRLAQVTTETDGLLLTLGVSPTGERWWVSRVDGVAAMLSGPLWLTSPWANGSSTWVMEALGRPGPFQVEQTPGGIAPWTPVGSPQPGPRLEIPYPAGDLFWRVKTVPAQSWDDAVNAAGRPALPKP